jgi:hypothetical protein
LPGRFNKLILFVSLVASLSVALRLSVKLAAQNTLQLYVRTAFLDNYRVSYDTGSGFSSTESMANTVFPSESEHGVARVNFAVPSTSQRLRLELGERPASISIVRICLERSLIVFHCADGADLAAFTEALNDARIATNRRELDFISTGSNPSVVFKNEMIRSVQPRNSALLWSVRVTLFLTAALFLFCAFVALLRPVALWLSPDAAFDAAFVVGAAAALRATFYHFYQPGTVSDSDWFLRYLQFHIYGQPGSRGIVYPIFTTLWEPSRDTLFAAQFFLGVISGVLALLLLRSFKRASRWDILWALLATSLPVLIGMETIVLSESLSLFLILSALLALRGLMENPRSGIAVAGLGCWCAMLYHTKPQFGFVIPLCAIAMAFPAWWPTENGRAAVRRTVRFLVPVAALQVLAMTLNFTSGNFLGTSSMLGYSVFNHGQQYLSCPPVDADPRVRFYCDARAALGPNAATTSYTAWVIYPAIHQLNEPFYRVTEDYLRLSLHVIAQHPARYPTQVLTSFIDFWTSEVPMTRNLYLAGNQNYPGLGRFMQGLLPAERRIREAIAAVYFVLLLAVIGKRAWPSGKGTVFWVVITGILIGSSVLQAIVESSPENSRYAVPTEPLVWIGVVYSTVLLRSRSTSGTRSLETHSR